MATSLLAACLPARGSGDAPARGGAKPVDLAPVWAGKTITMLVGTAPGGNPDTWARLFGRHLGKHLPGTPSIVVENVPGFDHRVAANRLYAARPDGLTIGATTRSLADFQILGDGPDDGIRYDAAKMGWLGSAASEQEVLAVHSRTGIGHIRQLETTPITIGFQTFGDSTHVFDALLRQSLGWHQGRRVFGWEGNSQILLAIDRGELDATISTWTGLLQRKQDDLAAGVLRPLVQGGSKIDHPLLAGVPTAAELLADKDPATRELLDFWERPYAYSRPYLTPPGLDPNVLAALRSAFMATLADPDFRAEVAQLRFTLDPIPGERLQDLILAQLQTPRAVVERLNALIQADAPS